MIQLPDNFSFSQTSLQDYVDCPRRFELRYLIQLEWPALQSEPVEEQELHMQQGHRFHQLVHQSILGIPVEQLTPFTQDGILSRWWQNFLEYMPIQDLPSVHYPEFTITTFINGSRVLAKYDLIAVEVGKRFVIMDWKTSRSKPPRGYLQKRIQTLLYPWLLVLGGSFLNDSQKIDPACIEMVYWFSNFPGEQERFSYNQAAYEKVEKTISNLIDEILHNESGKFMLTDRPRDCIYCKYRSLCERGERAGDWKTSEENGEADFSTPTWMDLEQIAEIEF
jgi:CRISPR/Cas system-associated exonuclease Cas4 (RecB family)